MNNLDPVNLLAVVRVHLLRLAVLAVVFLSILTDISAMASAASDTIKVEFSKTDSTVARDRKVARTYQFTVQLDKLVKETSYTVAVSVDQGKTTIGAPYYALEVPFSSITGTGEATSKNFFLTIQPDTLVDRDRTIVLNLTVKSAGGTAVLNKGTRMSLAVKVKGAGPELTDYNYLAYIGTNFDLVDGVQANNLFFAANVFIPRSTVSSKGMFMSLYGNRAVSSIDSSGSVTRITGKGPASDSTYMAYYSTADRVTTFSSDNLGAYFSPFFGMGRLSNKDNGVQYHFAPAAEFVWRRVKRTTTYMNVVPSDTVEEQGTVPTLLQAPNEFVQNENRFEFKIGPGFFVSHDNERISLHIYACTGWSTLFIPDRQPNAMGGDPTYLKRDDWFFSGRAWITEPTSGLTLQAEIVNTYSNPQPYYVVTLSKAIGFKNLGSFFAPITSR